MMRRISLGLVFVVVTSLSLHAQDPAPDRDAEKLKSERRAKLIGAILSDAGELRLPENRAFVAAKLGAIIWKDDQERAGTLFKSAIVDLIAAQAVAEANKNPNHQYHDLLNSQSLRPAILNAIAAVDAEFALESFYRSRPLAIERALSHTPASGKIGNSAGNYAHLAQQEINQEQRLIKMVAEQKPERSLALLKENIRKHLSGETLAMLKKVWEKEPTSANELANEVVDRLISKTYFTSKNQVNYELLNLSISILTEFLRERPDTERYIAFDESRMRSLSRKLIATYTERGASIGYVPLQQLEPIAKRFSPGSFEPLKKVAENTRNYGHHGGVQNNAEYTKLMQSNPTGDILIAEANKFPPEIRRSMYASAANKFSSAGQYDRAVALLSDQFEDDALENALSSLNWYHAHQLINRDEFDAAETMIMQFNESNRISALTSLATTIYGRDPEENRSRASGILQRVRSFLPVRPETSNEFSQLLLVNTMGGIDAAEAFRNFEPVVDQINEIAGAWSIVSRFQGGNIREGEHLMAEGLNLGFYIDQAIFRTLAEKDFARTVSLIDSFQRREMRIITLLGLLESGI